MFLFITLVVTLFCLGLYWFIGLYNEQYWKKRGVAFYTKNKVMGPMWDFLTSDQAVFACFDNIYKTYRNEPAVGFGALMNPAIYVIDIENIHHVLQADFQSFNHRGVETAPADKLSDQILFQTGERWKLMRQSMTPLFTTNKLSNMYYIIDKSARDFVEYLIKDPTKRKGDIFDTLNNFCAAAVGGAIFGITTKSIFDSPFVDMAREVSKPTLKQNLLFALASIKHNALRKLGLNLFSSKHEDFFIGAIKQVLRQREKELVGKKHDFADLAVTLQKTGKVVDTETGYELLMTDEVLAAQAFFYYVAGVEPTASAIYGTLLELGRNTEILKELNQELDEAWEKCNGNFTFEILNNMTYLEKVFNESMRMHPPIGILTRMAVRDSVLPIGNIKIDAGTKVFIPIFGLHNDLKYYSDPEKFDPERFSPENKSKYDNVYMPFGKGGRLCIGMRYARLQAKSGIIHLLKHFDVKTTVLPGGIKYSKQQVQVRPSNVKIELVYKKKSC